MTIYISIVVNADGQIDCEVLDSEPTESFRDGLYALLDNGDIENFEIREGNLNGGDSVILYSGR